MRRLPVLLPLGLVLLLVPLRADTPPKVARPDPGRTTFPPPALTVKVKPELAGVHPRLLMDAAGLKALREKVKDPAMALFVKSFFIRADQAAAEVPPADPPNTEDPFRGFGDRLPTLALAYLLSNDPKYLQAAVTWMEAIIHYPSWAGDGDLGAGHCTFGIAVAYDWLYAALTPAQRQEIEPVLRRHARLLARWAAAAQQQGKFWGAAYFQNHCWINMTAITAAAMALYDLDPAEAQDALNFTRSNFEIPYRHFGLDGSNAEGGGYARYGTEWMIYYIELLRGFSGEDLRDMPYLKGAAQYVIDNVMPDGHSTVTFTDWAPGAHDVSGETSLFWAEARFHDGAAEWFRQLRRNALNQHEDKATIGPFSLLWMDPSVKPGPPGDDLLTHVYPDIGTVFFRTGWDADAAMVAFTCAPPGGLHVMKHWSEFPNPSDSFGHDHPAANSFVFWADHDWRIGAPGGYTEMKVTHNENVWMADGKGQRGEAVWFEAKTYAGRPDQPHLVEVQDSDLAGYVVGEAGPAYDPESHITGFRRHLLFVKGKNPYVVVYDRLKASQPVAWTGYFHAFQPFDVKGGPFTIGGNTSTYGAFAGPGPLTFDNHPLIVTGHPEKKPVQRGFELAVSPAAPATSTSLVTVVGMQPQETQVTFPAEGPSVKVGADTITWDAQGDVRLNGRPISANRLAASAD